MKRYCCWFILLLSAIYANSMAEITPPFLQEKALVAPYQTSFVFPAEFEEQQSVWLAWPTGEKAQGYPVEEVILEMIKALQPHVRVDLMVQDEHEQDQVQRFMNLLNIPTDNLRFHVIPHDDIWIRDMGPIFLKSQKTQQLIIANFGFNEWGCLPQYAQSSMTEAQVPLLVARDLQFPVRRSWIISEGGNRDFNGQGTLMMTKAVETQRNPGWTLAELEAEHKRMFNVEKIIWLAKGAADDHLACSGKKLPGGKYYSTTTTGGHIDEYARFVNENTILLLEVTEQEAQESEVARVTRENMEENYQILKNATDQDGKPFNIIRAPSAVPIYKDLNKNDPIFEEIRVRAAIGGLHIGEDETITIMLPTSYLNFLISNGVVLIPKYWKEGRPEIVRQKDEQFKQIMEGIYPNRQIVQINPENLNYGGGGMHCASQQMPTQ